MLPIGREQSYAIYFRYCNSLLNMRVWFEHIQEFADSVAGFGCVPKRLTSVHGVQVPPPNFVFF